VLQFQIDRRGGLAPYLQLVQQVEQAIRLGTLVPGDQLPTAKSVVAALGINPNTVLKAYRELEHRGLVDARPGVGTFVRTGAPMASMPEHPRLRSRLASWMLSARAAGLAEDDVQALVTSALRDVYDDSSLSTVDVS
jgi:DNA-binding transcriptional regulator YhcF (GntR family)